MDLFWKTTAGVLLTVILVMAAGKQEKHIGTVMILAVCCMVSAVAFTFLEPVLNLFLRMEDSLILRSELLIQILKVSGIAIVTEIAAMICQDSAMSSLGKTLQILGTSVILYLSVPLFEELMILIQDILGGL